jgi:hypothetical protein
MHMTFPTRMRALTAIVLGGFLVACHEITDPPKAVGIRSLDAPATAVADAATLVPITVKIDTLLAENARAVTLSTTAGRFDDDDEVTVSPDSSGTVVAFLTPPSDTTTALITATVGTHVLRRQIAFTRAPAEQLIVNTESFVIEAEPGADIDVTAELRRLTGRPSPGIQVAFSATDTTGATIGTFSNPLPSDSAGRVTARFTVGATPYRGRVTVRATTVGTTPVLTGQATVQVVSPSE